MELTSRKGDLKKKKGSGHSESDTDEAKQGAPVAMVTLPAEATGFLIRLERSWLNKDTRDLELADSNRNSFGWIEFRIRLVRDRQTVRQTQSDRKTDRKTDT